MSHYLVTFLVNREKPVGEHPSESALEAPSILILTDTITGRKDTLVMDISMPGEERHFQVMDFTRDLAFKNLVFQVEWQGESDHIYAQVVGFKDDTLTKLFDVPAASPLTDLKRKDDHTLLGHCNERDDLVHVKLIPYIVTVSLPDYDADIRPPDTMDYHYHTEATELIHAYRRGESGEKAYSIHPGEKILIDTFFYNVHQVTLRVKDSIFLRVDEDEIKGKVRGNNAG
jgi:hypothetical protein